MSMKDKSCLILMASFNGEKYIRQQLDSILNQTHEQFNLIIRDDGSSDSTAEILKQYAKYDKRIVILQNGTGKHGAYRNFWTLIHYARENCLNYDYYFFSDQDDIWEHDKLAVMLETAEKQQSEKPLLLYGDMQVIDRNNRIKYYSLNQVMGIGEISGYSLFFTHGFLWGCDICVNRTLFNKVPLLPLDHPHIDIISHDNYFGKYALTMGQALFIDQILVRHRRHSENTTGGYAMALSPTKVVRKVFPRLDDLAKTHARVYYQTLVYIEQYEKQTGVLPPILQKIKEAINTGGQKMVRTMRELQVRRKQPSRTLGIYYIALTKAYKKFLYGNKTGI